MQRKIKYLVGISLVFISFFYGMYVGTRKVFPFKYLLELKNSTVGKRTGRFSDTSNRTKINNLLGENTGVFITYGQSNSADYGELGYSVKNNVYQFFDDKIYKYEDPSLGGTGYKGSVWGMVGDKLIGSGQYQQIVFSITGWGSKSLEELNQGSLYEYFKKEYQHLYKKFGKVDGILFHQGEGNHEQNAGNKSYQKDFELFLAKMKKDSINAPIFLSQASYCEPDQPKGIDKTLLNIQDNLIKKNEGVLRGPNTDSLINKGYRLNDNCHFTLLGFDKFSTKWVEAIIKKSEQ